MGRYDAVAFCMCIGSRKEIAQTEKRDSDEG